MSAVGKVTTAALVPGSRILVAPAPDARGGLDIARRKTGALVATVERVEVMAPSPYGRQSRRLVRTDRGELICSPSQTHMLAPGGSPAV